MTDDGLEELKISEIIEESVPTSFRTLTASIYYNLVSYENHYNMIQNKYKALATTWIVATFLGIGYLLTGMEVALPVNVLLAILFLCLLSAEGVSLLWFLDVGVYYKLIESIFQQTLLMEKKYKYLGRSHHNIIKLHEERHDPMKFLSMFYSSIILFLILIASICLSFYLYKTGSVYFTISFIVPVFYFVFFFNYIQKT